MVEQLDEELKTSSGIALPESTKDKPIKGIVLVISDIMDVPHGLLPLKENHTLYEEYAHLVGKKVVFKRWSTTDLEEDGKKLSFVAFADILGVYE